jgi:hypothetical protein
VKVWVEIYKLKIYVSDVREEVSAACDQNNPH